MKRTARTLFSRFDLILAADQRTAEGLSNIIGKDIQVFGNLKTMNATPGQARESSAGEISWPGPVLLGASTHDGEEVFLMESLEHLADDMKLILAPRHPERGDAIAEALSTRHIPFARWSAGESPGADHKVLLADTIGDMENWYALADHIYVGGAHTLGAGGHNPLEALAHGKPVLTGPHTFNFSDMIKQLSELDAVHVVQDGEDLKRACEHSAKPDMAALAAYMEAGQTRIREAAERLSALLPAPQTA